MENKVQNPAALISLLRLSVSQHGIQAKDISYLRYILKELEARKWLVEPDFHIPAEKCKIGEMHYMTFPSISEREGVEK